MNEIDIKKKYIKTAIVAFNNNLDMCTQVLSSVYRAVSGLKCKYFCMDLKYIVCKHSVFFAVTTMI